MRKFARAYDGPQCPYCEVTLAAEKIRTGSITCGTCGRDFEATAFDPPRRPPRLAQPVIGAGPDGANACATHPGNAAVTSCERCGLFICSLCEMNVGSGSYCPACFDRVRAEGMLPEVATSYRDHASMARLSIIAGILFWFLSPLFGGLALFYSLKGLKQRRKEGRSRLGVVVVMVIALAQVLGSVLVFAFLAWSLFQTAGGAS